ncbi:hypothetical protein KAFR_0F01130 [Kazachstania africana CBS 2517]|uniref:Uncharacterized protein n=1 Tax=Kazachstania africana (strain ATCC 22294 / BCRC 22015 / CBS 2517 / CECT 1963 / NBRC 1671 / NRRL Y-8276) TaxID=1071382 RepID=H2AWF9_KAZAF|nr:hypothetical protein KAFR_0F01130 [Kazachstania africana CBS 2517]CCF58709.1 hypothetical protein KAFR_0F01130 [Kazachstania africana CBS 2517]
MALHTEPLEQEDQDSIILDARAGDLESLQEIFTTLIDPKLLTTCRDSSSKSSALHMAAGNGHLEVVKYITSLIDSEEREKFVNIQNESGNTALHWASLNGKLDVVQYLCDECNADPFLRNQFGHDAIFEAENNGREEIETYFLKKYDVEPESDGEETAPEQIKITEGTESEQVTKDATEALRQHTENLSINN